MITTPLARTLSAPLPAQHLLAPNVRRFDTLTEPFTRCPDVRPGTLSIALNPKSQWQRLECAPDSLLQDIELRPSKGLLNLTTSVRFATAEWGQTKRRDLHRAIVSTIEAYNEAAAATGSPLITVHENHWTGDGRHHGLRQLPRRGNERDFDYFHTLGVNYAPNGQPLWHYHLRFWGELTRQTVAPFLETLVGIDADGESAIMARADVDAALATLRRGRPTALDTTLVRSKLRALPSQLATPVEQATRRDELEGTFIALASADTERTSNSAFPASEAFLQNMHMNTHRQTEPRLSCVLYGRTAIGDDLDRVEAHPSALPGQQLDTAELLAIHFDLAKLERQLDAYEPEPAARGDLQDGARLRREQLEQRIAHAKEKIRAALSGA